MKKEIFKFFILLMVAIGAHPASTAVYQWSTTAASNGTADPTINFAEGQAPSSVNDSARALMAAVAFWRKDTSGSNLQTSGTSSAYTITSNEGFSSTTAMIGAVLNFYPHVSNAAGASLNVDGLGAFALRIDSANPLPAGAFRPFGHYTATFSLSLGAWIVENYYDNSFTIPLGAYLYTSVSSAPNANFVAADGSCISRTTYAAYFSAVGTAYGACDGVSTFGVPDMRGRVAAMLDGGAGRLTSAANGCGVSFNSLGVSCGSESQTLTLAQSPTGITSAVSVTTGTNNVGTIPISSGAVSSLQTQGAATTNITPNNSGGSWSGSTSLAGVGSGSATSNNTSGTAHPIVQPTYGINVYVRVI